MQLRRSSIAGLLALAGACAGDALLGADRPPPQQPGEPADASEYADAGKQEQSGKDASQLLMPDASAQAPVPAALSVHFVVDGIEAVEAQTACSSACTLVTVITTGGVGPYGLRWSDGSVDRERSFCPTKDTVLSVRVEDASGQTAEVALRQSSPACAVAVSNLCIDNPSLEGDAVFGIAWFSASVWRADAWDDCDATNEDSTPSMPHVVGSVSTLDDRYPFPDATHGATYFYLEANARQHQYVGQELCEPMRAQTQYALQFDLASAPTDSQAAVLGPAQLELYASANPCARGELLWTSPLLDKTWRTFCVVLHPSQDASSLVLNPLGPMGNAAVLVDHLVPVESCP